MSLVGNVLWIFLGGGLIIFFQYLIGGLALCFTVVGIPFGLQCFKMAFLGLVPFGKEIVYTGGSPGCLSTLMNIIWIIVGGVWIALVHLVFALLCAITVIGIPFSVQHMKLARLSITPFGHDIR